MICPPCAQAADASTRLRGGHSPHICRDLAIQPGGCACQHKPIIPPAKIARSGNGN